MKKQTLTKINRIGKYLGKRTSKKAFSTKWKASKQPRKQRKYAANAPLHLKRKLLSTNLSKELRKKHGKRNIPIRKGDSVKIIKGKFKNKRGKVLEVKTKTSKVYVEGIQIKKMDGSKVNVPVKVSSLQILELNLDDKKRLKIKTTEKKSKSENKEKSETKTQEKKAEEKTK